MVCTVYVLFFRKSSLSCSSMEHMVIRADSTAQDAFAEAFELYADDIFRHCSFRCFDRERARELMQETFMKVWEYLSKGNDIDNVRALLYRTANNLIIDQARRNAKRQVTSYEDLAEEGFDIAGDDGRDEARRFDARQVAKVLRQIEEPYRSALVMRYIDDLPPKDIANVTGETANVISVRLNRGLKLLRALLPAYE